MNVEITYNFAPSLVDWSELLQVQGWKIIHNTNNKIKAKKEIGQSEFPVRNATVWYLEIWDELDSGCTLRIDVPAFAESTYARKRLFSMIDDLAMDVSGKCETDEMPNIDILGELRQRYEK